MPQAKIQEILKPVAAEEEARQEQRVRAGFWRTARRAARHIPFMDEVVAAYFAALDPKTPTRVRGTLLAALAYFVMPADLIPDFLIGFGFTDDLAVLMAAMTSIRGHITQEHRKAAREALDGAQP
ncbi:YkvA family protein [Mesorhizobium sp. CAU 1741]|uniref:YkvA family protein n=1 Tax=Mesorhizobium sp. CAU 1741 TaxID=3140366 RepID=UPI00325BCBC6